MFNLQLRTPVRWLVIVVSFLHGAIHLLGTVKGFGWADVDQLNEAISVPMGFVWLIAAVLVVAAALFLAVGVRWWWAIGGLGVLVSQVAILTSWSDAKAGTAANLLLLAAVIHGYASQGPTSFRADYRRLVGPPRTLENASARGEHIVTEDDLTHLPELVAAYVRQSGAVGQPVVTSLNACIHGRIRGAATKPWMSFVGEQVNTFGREPSRVLFMDATMLGLPVDVLHSFVGSSATMRVKVGSLLSMVDASGSDMDRAETVTLFNDMCVLAPAALIDAWVVWTTLDDRHVLGTFTKGTHSVSAELVFNGKGELVDFISDDRLRATPDGRRFTRQRWSTPVRDYTKVGARRVATFGEARWFAPEPEGEFRYLEFHLDDIQYNESATHPSPTSTRLASRSSTESRQILLK